MNSNIRETFGILDKETGKQYSDIINAFLLSLRITEEDKHFLLHCDSKVKREIKEKGYCNCIVSFQTRSDCKIALARKLRD